MICGKEAASTTRQLNETTNFVHILASFCRCYTVVIEPNIKPCDCVVFQCLVYSPACLFTWQKREKSKVTAGYRATAAQSRDIYARVCGGP